MYKGVVNVSEEQLTPFLETAKALKIKGIFIIIKSPIYCG